MADLDVNHADQPKLPPELEEYIFDLAVDQKLSDAWNYLLVAKRIHHWLIPRIFNIVVFSDHHPSPIRFNLSIIERYAKHVRHLFIDPNELVQHLPLFTNVTDLVICRSDHELSHLPVILSFNNLTRLSVGIDGAIKDPDPLYFSLFTKVTHLDLNSYCTSWSPAAIEKYINLPLLTHLCVIGGLNTGVAKVFLDRDRCPNLEVVWWDSLYEGDGAETCLTPEYEVDDFARGDEQIVPLSVIDMRMDWENGAKGLDDMWRVADKEIASRRGR